MTLELLYAITHADDKARVEDLYLSCKPKRLTMRHFMKELHAASSTICNAPASQRFMPIPTRPRKLHKDQATMPAIAPCVMRLHRPAPQCERPHAQTHRAGENSIPSAPR